MIYQAIGLGLVVTASLSPGILRAQVVQQWSHQAVFGDASAGIAMGDTLMFVVDNEDEVIRLYRRSESVACGTPVYSVDMRPNLNPLPNNPEADLEAGVKVAGPGGVRIYWLGSLGNSRTGNLRPNRNRLFATQVNGNGSGSPPYTLSYVGRYDHLRDDLIDWDRYGLHGLGAHYFGLEASAAAGVVPTSIEGFNVEGLTMARDGETAYIAFRTPFVNGSGPTTTPAERTHALIVPLLNMTSLVTGNPTPGPGAAQFGPPITLDLGGRGVRSIDCSYAGQYLITAGPANDPSNPPAPPLDFRLFTWSGYPTTPPVERTTSFPHGYSPEGAIVPPVVLGSSTLVQFISDDGSPCWKSFTATVGGIMDPTAVPPGPARPDGIRFSRLPGPSPARDAVSFAITIPREQWVDLSVDDLEGRHVATLWRGVLTAGEHPFSWDGAARSGRRAGAGIYAVQLRTAGMTIAKRFALLH